MCISLYNVCHTAENLQDSMGISLCVYIHTTSAMYYFLLDLRTASGVCVMEADQIGLTFRGGDLRPPSVEYLASLSRCSCLVLQNQRD